MNEFSRTVFHSSAKDGYAIACHMWQPVGVKPSGRIVVLHGIQSHAGWYGELGGALARAGLSVVMPDRRGSGVNASERGHAWTSGQLVSDLDSVIAEWNRITADERQPVIAGISWGGKLALVTAARRAGKYRGLALIAPGLFAKVRPALGTQLSIAGNALMHPHKLFDIPLADASLFTDNVERQHFIETDGLTLHKATARFFIVSRAMDLSLNRCRKRLRLPVLLQLAGQDRIVDNARIRRYVESIPIAVEQKTVIEYPAAHHTIEFDQGADRTKYAQDLAVWAQQLF